MRHAIITILTLFVIINTGCGSQNDTDNTYIPAEQIDYVDTAGTYYLAWHDLSECEGVRIPNLLNIEQSGSDIVVQNENGEIYMTTSDPCFYGAEYMRRVLNMPYDVAIFDSPADGYLCYAAVYSGYGISIICSESFDYPFDYSITGCRISYKHSMNVGNDYPDIYLMCNNDNANNEETVKEILNNN